jgi:hypothetical protein
MRWLVLPVALCAVSPAAFAMDPSLRGFYIGGAIGNATVEFEDDWTGDTFDADDTGYKIIVGYRTTRSSSATASSIGSRWR